MTVGGPEQTLPLGRRHATKQRLTAPALADASYCPGSPRRVSARPRLASANPNRILRAGPTRPRRQAFGLLAAAPVVRLRANGRYRDPLAVPQWVDAGPWPLPGRLTRIWRCGGGLEMGYGPRDLACGQGFKL